MEEIRFHLLDICIVDGNRVTIHCHGSSEPLELDPKTMTPAELCALVVPMTEQISELAKKIRGAEAIPGEPAFVNVGDRWVRLSDVLAQLQSWVGAARQICG